MVTHVIMIMIMPALLITEILMALVDSCFVHDDIMKRKI